MRWFSLMGLGAIAALLAGCNPVSMAISGGKFAAQEVIGAEAKIRPLAEFTKAQAEAYRAIRIGEVTTDVPAIVPAEKMAIIRTEMELKLTEESKKLFPEGGKTLIANVAARFLKERGTFGGEARLDMIATLVDADTQEEVARLFIEGISKSLTAGKVDDMAKENARELLRHLAKRQKGDAED